MHEIDIYYLIIFLNLSQKCNTKSAELKSASNENKK